MMKARTVEICVLRLLNRNCRPETLGWRFVAKLRFAPLSWEQLNIAEFAAVFEMNTLQKITV